MTGTILGQLIAIGVSPILTRIYSPQDLGFLSVFVSIAAILAVMVTWRYEMAIMLPKDDKDGWSIVMLSLLLALGTSLILFGIIVIFNKQITNFIQIPILFNPKYSSVIKNVNFGFYLYLIPLSTFFMGCFQIFSYWSTRQKQFKHLAITKTMKETAIAGTQIGSGTFFIPQPLGLIAGQIVGNIIATLILILNVVRDSNIYQCISWKKIIENAKKYKNFPLFSSWAGLMNAISQNIPILFLFVLYSPEIAGFYAIAIRVLSLPTMLISNSVKQVFFQKISKKKYNHHSIIQLFKKTTISLFLISIVPLFIILLWGETLFSVVFGVNWKMAGIFSSIIAPWVLLGFINPPSTMIIFTFQMNRFQFIYELLLLIFRIAAIISGFLWFEDVIVSLHFLVIIGVIFNCFLIIIAFIKISQYEKEL